MLGPIAAVVIGGASLTGGLASATSTWAAAFFLVLLSQMLRVLGLPSALQFVIFGAAIVGGMVVSGDRIITVVERLFQGLSVEPKDVDFGRGDESLEPSNTGTLASPVPIPETQERNPRPRD
jgi:hypothetical protein